MRQNTVRYVQRKIEERRVIKLTITEICFVARAKSNSLHFPTDIAHVRGKGRIIEALSEILEIAQRNIRDRTETLEIEQRKIGDRIEKLQRNFRDSTSDQSGTANV